MESKDALVKIAVRRGDHLHFLYDDCGPAFTCFPKDRLVQHSRAARLQLQGSQKDVFVIPIHIEQVNGNLSALFHVLDFIKTHGGSATPADMPLADFPFFQQLLQIYYATVVLGLDGGLEQPRLRMLLLHMAWQRQHISVADVLFIWRYLRTEDRALLSAAMRNLVSRIDHGALKDEEDTELKEFMAEDAAFRRLFEDSRTRG